MSSILYLTVDKDGTEKAFNEIPSRYVVWIYDRKLKKRVKIPPTAWERVQFDPDGGEIFYGVELPSGTISKLTGQNITWEDNFITYEG